MTSHPFTCNTCQVAFNSSDLQRTHMQADWHRYNLKRRVASLPPLSSEIFAEKVLANRATAAATAARASFEKACEPCGKTYFSDNAYINHLSSQKHKTNVAKATVAGPEKKEDEVKSVMSSTFSLGETAGTSSVHEEHDSEAEEELLDVIGGMKESSLEDSSDPVSRRPSRPHHSVGPDYQPDHPDHPALRRSSTSTTNGRLRQRDPLKECLFCSHMFDSLGAAVEHMVKTHGLFIPEPNYVSDIEGLVKYLNQKVNEEYQCLYCGRLKWSEDGIKTHMRDMSHCKIAYETEEHQLEIGQFYDFRATYSDDDWDSDEDEDVSDEDSSAAPGGGVKLGLKRDTKTSLENGDEAMEDAGWETDSTVSSCPTEELGRVYVDEQRDEVKQRLRQNRHHNHTDSRPHRSTDGYHSHAHTTPHAVYHDEVEMHLPSGRTAGHRAMNKYWRQNLRTHPSADERAQRLLTTGDSSDDARELRGSQAAKDRERGRGREVAMRNDATGIAGIDDSTKRALKVTEKKEQRRAQRDQRKFMARVNEKGNNQKHFRDPLLQ